MLTTFFIVLRMNPHMGIYRETVFGSISKGYELAGGTAFRSLNQFLWW
jgi:hypothetical protein